MTDIASNDTVATGEWWVDVLSSVKITVTDPETILRVVNNHTDEKRPARKGVEGEEDERGWQDIYYGAMTVEQVMEHLAFNCAANGVEDARRLDGWADLEPGVLTMHLDRVVEYERVLAPDA